MKSVAQYTKDMELIAVFKSMTAASLETGVPLKKICDVCKYDLGVRSAEGFNWSYYSSKPPKVLKNKMRLI